MLRIFTLAIKDLRLLIRDRFGLFWVIAFPLLMALFFGSIFSSGGSTSRSLKIAAVSDNATENAEQFYGELEKADVLSVARLPLDSARMMVSNGKLVAYVHYKDTLQSEYGFFSSGAPSIEVGIDPSRKAETGYLRGLINQAYFQSLQRQMTDLPRMRKLLQNEILQVDSSTGLAGEQKTLLKGFLGNLDDFLGSVDTADDSSSSIVAKNSPFGKLDIDVVNMTIDRKAPKSSWEITFPQALQWALIGCAAAFALSIVTERTRGTFLRLRLAPLSRVHILAGKGLACFIACVVVTSGLLAFGVLVFDVRVASLGGLVLAVGSAAVCFVGLMMFISVIGKTEQAVGGAGWAIFLVMAMTGGGMVPLMFMPGWFSAISDFSPIKWSILASEGAIWRGFDYSQMMLPVGILLAVGLVAFSAGVLILSRTDN
ncbi:MAG: ABC transporter permease [Anaerolineales bacterium]|jgi:ABC-2 type transport system permease protein